MPRNKKSKSAGEMQQLITLLSKLTTQQNKSPPKPAKRRRRRARKNNSASKINGTAGGVIITKTELLGSLIVKSGKATAVSGTKIFPESFGFLGNFAKNFDRSRWRALTFEYRPAVSMMTGGLVSMGVDWDFKVGDSPTRQQVSSMTPNVCGAVWRADMPKIVCPANRLSSREWYLHGNGNADDVDRGPCRLAIAADVTTATADTVLGEVWATYTVEFYGTQ